jgi:hypothetical protein
VNQLLRQFRETQQLIRSPGMLGGLLGGGKGARLADALSGSFGAGDGFGALDGGSITPKDAAVGRSAKNAKGKKKKGGRVTPKRG